MKQILVPVDFTPSSLNAVNYATAMATTHNMRITLFHVLELYQYAAWVQETEIITPVFPLDDIIKTETLALKNLQQIITDIKQTNNALQIDYLLLKGSYIDELITQSSLPDTALLVLSTFNNHDFLDNTKTSMREMFYESACPIILVPQHFTYTLPQHLLYVTNYHQYDIPLIKSILNSLSPLQITIKILSVLSQKPDFESNLKQLGFQKLLETHFPTNLFTFETIRNKEIDNAIKDNIIHDKEDIVILVKENKSILQLIFEHVHISKLSTIINKPIMFFSERLIEKLKLSTD